MNILCQVLSRKFRQISYFFFRNPNHKNHTAVIGFRKMKNKKYRKKHEISRSIFRIKSFHIHLITVFSYRNFRKKKKEKSLFINWVGGCGCVQRETPEHHPRLPHREHENKIIRPSNDRLIHFIKIPDYDTLVSKYIVNLK